MIIKRYKTVIIGSGPAGLQAALTLYKNGERDILIIERSENLGGIPLQCNHSVYSIDEKGYSFNGPEFISFYTEKVRELGIDYYTSCTVKSISKNKSLMSISPTYGSMFIKFKALIVATGAIEMPLSSLCIPSSRPNNIITQGMAEKQINIDKNFPFSNVIFIGANYTTTNFAFYLLENNINVEYIMDVNNYYKNTEKIETNNKVIKIIHHSEIDSIEGRPNVKSIKVGDKTYKCDTVIVSLGFEENRDLLDSSQISIIDSNNQYYALTDTEGVYVCGNAYKIFSKTEDILKSAQLTGEAVSTYITAK